MEIVIKLLFAHIIGDFFIQPDKWCKLKKEKSRAALIVLTVHALIISFLSYLLVADWHCLWIPTTILISHFCIDLIKNKQVFESVKIFTADQLAHMIVIMCIAYIYTRQPIINIQQNYESLILYATSYLLVLTPASIFIKLFTKRWIPKDSNAESLPNAGKWIGYLERVLILTFIFTNHIEGIGFILAAKSIFRFGDLNRAKDVRTTEYVVLGTFMSFTISILVGFAASSINIHGSFI